MMQIAACVLLGIAAALFVWAGWDLIGVMRLRDEGWLRHVVWRFTPEPFEPRPWVNMWYGAALAVLVGGSFVFPTPVIALFFAVGVLIVPRPIVGLVWDRHRAKIDQQLPDAISTMANSVQAGLSLVQAIERLASYSPEPIRTEFRVMVNRYRHGADLDETLQEAKRRLDLPNFNLFASALLINREMGGEVGEALDRIATALESVEEMRGKVMASTSGGRSNLKILSISPFVFLLLMLVVEREGVILMFTTITGWIVLGVAAALSTIGGWWGYKIMHADV